MDATDLKSISEKLYSNILSFGDASSRRQQSLQFNIWKQCIEQREKDEMLFTVIICLIMIGLSAFN